MDEDRSLTPAEESEFRRVARARLRAGFRTPDRVLEAALVSSLSAPAGPAVEQAGRALVAQEWAAREAELAAASGPDDHTRLRAAFDALAVEGVLGRMDFGRSMNWAHDEIDFERTPLPDADPDDPSYAEWAFVFFHEQDTDCLGEGEQPLYLAFGTFDPDPEPAGGGAAGGADEDERWERAAERVGRVIAAALTAQGLTVEWDGSASARIGVRVPDWRKPLPDPAAEA